MQVDRHLRLQNLAAKAHADHHPAADPGLALPDRLRLIPNVFDYLAETNSIPEVERPLAQRMKNYAAKLSEPMISSFDPTRIESDFDTDGEWEVVLNDSPADQQKRYVEGHGDVYVLLPVLVPAFEKARLTGPLTGLSITPNGFEYLLRVL